MTEPQPKDRGDAQSDDTCAGARAEACPGEAPLGKRIGELDGGGGGCDPGPSGETVMPSTPGMASAKATSSPSQPGSPVRDSELLSGLDTLLLRQDERHHWVDLRVTIPFFGRGMYLVVLAGKERRSSHRRRRDRTRYPILTLGNMLLIAAGVALAYVVALIALLAMQSFSGPSGAV